MASSSSSSSSSRKPAECSFTQMPVPANGQCPEGFEKKTNTVLIKVTEQTQRFEFCMQCADNPDNPCPAGKTCELVEDVFENAAVKTTTWVCKCS